MNWALYWGLMASLIIVLSLTVIILGGMWLYYLKVKKQVEAGTYKGKKSKQNVDDEKEFNKKWTPEQKAKYEADLKEFIKKLDEEDKQKLSGENHDKK